MKYNKIENKLKFDYNNMMASYIGENRKSRVQLRFRKPRKRLDGLDGTSLQPEGNRRRYS